MRLLWPSFGLLGGLLSPWVSWDTVLCDHPTLFRPSLVVVKRPLVFRFWLLRVPRFRRLIGVDQRKDARTMPGRQQRSVRSRATTRSRTSVAVPSGLSYDSSSPRPPPVHLFTPVCTSTKTIITYDFHCFTYVSRSPNPKYL